MRILVIDDHVELLAEIAQFLVKIGHDVVTATGANEAMQIVHSDRDYQVVVTDISMPGMSGIEMWENMCPLLPRAKVIFISSTNNSFLRKYLPGVFLSKPFRLDHLRRAIQQLQPAAA